MFGLHSPSRYWDFQISWLLMRFYNFLHACFDLSIQILICHSSSRYLGWNLQPGFRFSLSMEVLGLHSQADVGLFNLFLFNLNFSWGFAYFMRFHIFILSLPKQAVGCHSPCRCLVYILQADVGFFKKNCSIFICHGV